MPDIAEVWRRGSVIASWLLDLTASALAEDPELVKFAGHVSDSGEGRWTIQAAVEEGAPAPVLSTALYQRFTSRGSRRIRRSSCCPPCAINSAGTSRKVQNEKCKVLNYGSYGRSSLITLPSPL